MDASRACPCFSQDCPDLTTDDTSRCHPHDTPVHPAVSSQTAGSGPRPQAQSDPFFAAPIGSSGAVTAVRKLLSPGRRSLPNHDRLEPSDHAQSDPFSTTGDGPSRPPHLFKKTTV